MKYFVKINGKLEPANMANGYYLTGFQYANDKGRLVTSTHVPGIGTGLVPVFNESGQPIFDVSKAGQDFKPAEP